MKNAAHICHCGKQIPQPRNSTIWSKECPNCQLKKALKKPIKTTIKGEKTVKTRKQKTPTQKLDKKLDEVWSQLVKIKAGNKCEVCGSTQNLNSHHLYSRAKKSVRWNLDNGICLCVGHHIGNSFSAHKTPLAFQNWLINYKGEYFIRDLEIRANIASKWSMSEKELLLKTLKDKLNNETYKSTL